MSCSDKPINEAQNELFYLFFSYSCVAFRSIDPDRGLEVYAKKIRLVRPIGPSINITLLLFTVNLTK